MNDTHSIVIPENVELKFEIAGIGSRFVAYLIDSLIQSCAFFCLFIALLALSGFSADWKNYMRNLPTTIIAYVLIFLLVVILLGYHIILETIFNGQTIGKRVLNIRVRKEQGGPLTFWDVLLRNFLRLADMLPSFYIIGIIVMFFNQKSKRLGDFAAGTIVVREISRKKMAQFLAANRITPENAAAPEAVATRYDWISAVLIFITQPDYLMMKNLLTRQRELGNFNELASNIIHKILINASQAGHITFNSREAGEIIKEMVAVYERTYC